MNDFDRLASRLFAIYYAMMCTQIVFTTITALFHSFISRSTVNVPAGTARVVGTTFGALATLIATLLASFPVEVCARQCRNAYALSFEFYVTDVPVPNTVLDYLYEVDTLCFENPLYTSKCVTVRRSRRRPPLPVVDPGSMITSESRL